MGWIRVIRAKSESKVKRIPTMMNAVDQELLGVTGSMVSLELMFPKEMVWSS